MKRSSVAGLIVVVVALAAGSFYLGRSTTPPQGGTATGATAGASAADTRKVLYWHDPMVPAQRFDKPGKSPFMDMQLVPVYADSDPTTSGVKVSPQVQQNLGIRSAIVRRAEAASSFDAIGTVQFDERLSVAVQTRVAGYVERLSVRAPMERVRRGQTLATIYAPDWLGPQNELLALKRAGVSAELVGAARERMRTMSIPPELIAQGEKNGIAQARFTLSSPVSGVVAELGVREGVAVTPGTTLFRISGLEQVWAVAEVPETQAGRLVRGQKVKAVLQSDASQSFSGELKEVLPEVSASTRTLKARFEVDNKAGKLTPGMLFRLQLTGPKSTLLVVPAEAVIRTGKRAVVIVHKEGGVFEPREVALGVDVGEDVEVVRGLAEGERVIASGQFLIDSEARLRSVLGSMAAAPSAAPPAGAVSAPTALPGLHAGDGKVESVAPDAITISHGPIATLKWPAMTMGFAKPSAAAFPGVRRGDTVHFEFKEGGPSGYELVRVEKLGGAAK